MNRDRPIPDAAAEVQALAADARAMLADLKRGWLWVFLTSSPRPKPGESKDQ